MGYLVYGKSGKGAKRYLTRKKVVTPLGTKKEAESFKKILRERIKKSKSKVGWKVYSKKL